jgi:hypothetical protein
MSSRTTVWQRLRGGHCALHSFACAQPLRRCGEPESISTDQLDGPRRFGLLGQWSRSSFCRRGFWAMMPLAE